MSGSDANNVTANVSLPTKQTLVQLEGDSESAASLSPAVANWTNRDQAISTLLNVSLIRAKRTWKLSEINYCMYASIPFYSKISTRNYTAKLIKSRSDPFVYTTMHYRALADPTLAYQDWFGSLFKGLISVKCFERAVLGKICATLKKLEVLVQKWQSTFEY